MERLIAFVRNRSAALAAVAAGLLVGWGSADRFLGETGTVALRAARAEVEYRLSDSARQSAAEKLEGFGAMDESGRSVEPAITGYFRSVLALAESDSPAEIRRMIEGIEALPAELRDAAQDLLVRRWVQIDPEGALGFVIAAQPDGHSPLGLSFARHFAADWARGCTGEQVAARAAAIFGGFDQIEAFRQLAANFSGNTDSYIVEAARHMPPDGLIAALRAMKIEIPLTANRELYKRWAIADAGEAMASARALEGEARAEAMAGLVAGLLEAGEFAQIEPLLGEAGGGPAALQIEGEIVFRRALDDFAGAEAAVLARPEGGRGRAAANLMRALALTDPADAERWALENLSGSDREDAFAAAARGAVNFDSATAIRFAPYASPAQRTGIAAELVRSTVLFSGWEKLPGLMAALDDPVWRRSMAVQALDPNTEAPPGSPPLSFTADLAPLIEEAAPAIPAGHFGRAGDWAAQWDEGGEALWAALSGEARWRLAPALAAAMPNDPAAAADLVRGRPDSVALRQAVGAIAERFARLDPDAAVRWVGDLDGEAQARAAAIVARTIPPGRRGGWLADLPPGPARDGVAQTYAESSLARRDPSAALAYAALIQDPARRDHAAAEARRWLAFREPGAADQAAKSASRR